MVQRIPTPLPPISVPAVSRSSYSSSATSSIPPPSFSSSISCSRMEYRSGWAETQPHPPPPHQPPSQHLHCPQGHQSDPYYFTAPPSTTYPHHHNPTELAQPDLSPSLPPSSLSKPPYQQHNPNPTSIPHEYVYVQFHSGPSASSHSHYYPPGSAATALRPPGVDPYVAPSSYAPLYSGYEHHGPDPYPYPLASSYYPGGSGGAVGADGQTFSVKEAIRQYGTDPVAHGGLDMARHPNGLEIVAPHLNLQETNWQAHHHHSNRTMKKKGIKGISKIVQSAYCEVCKVDCNSQEVLNSHKFGKKHKKNLEKLTESIAFNPPKSAAAAAAVSTTTATAAPPPTTAAETIGNNKSSRIKKKTAPGTEEDLETKKRKVLEGGAAKDAVKVCTLCNVVCNSEVVFNYHLAGQRHIAMVKKQHETSAS